MPQLIISHQPQLKASDCLVACAAMALKHLDVRFRYNRLTKRLHTRQSGTAFRNLRYLSELNLIVKIKYGDMQTLFELIDNGIPVIARVQTEPLSYWSLGTDHAIVVVGYDDKSIWVNDPYFEDAPKRVTQTEFELAWLDGEYLYATIER